MSSFFHGDCNITDGTYKGLEGGRDWEGVGGGVGGWEANGGLNLPLRYIGFQLLCRHGQFSQAQSYFKKTFPHELTVHLLRIHVAKYCLGSCKEL